MIIFMLVMLIVNIIFIVKDFANTLRVHIKKLSRRFYNYILQKDVKTDLFKRIAEFCKDPMEISYDQAVLNHMENEIKRREKEKRDQFKKRFEVNCEKRFEKDK